MRPTIYAACLLTAGLLAAGPVLAETVNYTATLKGASETPPNTSQGTGTLKATYDTATKMLDWTADYSGLTGEATMAHFHGPAPAGKSAGVMVPIKGSVASPIKGSAPLTAAQAKALMDGDMYFNVHTKANPGGEIRGQLEKAM